MLTNTESASKLIRINENIDEPIESVNLNEMKLQWKTQMRKKIQMNRESKISVGNENHEAPAMIKLKAIERRAWIFLANLDESVIPEDIISSITETQDSA